MQFVYRVPARIAQHEEIPSEYLKTVLPREGLQFSSPLDAAASDYTIMSLGQLYPVNYSFQQMEGFDVAYGYNEVTRQFEPPTLEELEKPLKKASFELSANGQKLFVPVMHAGSHRPTRLCYRGKRLHLETDKDYQHLVDETMMWFNKFRDQPETFGLPQGEELQQLIEFIGYVLSVNYNAGAVEFSGDFLNVIRYETILPILCAIFGYTSFKKGTEELKKKE